MKKIILKLMLTFIIVSITKINFAQVSVPANAGGPANYVGWNSTQPQDLTIKHENNRFINFYTNAGAGGFNNPRMRILSGGLTGNGATTDGFIGIGDFNFFAPLNLLHQHLNYNRSNFHQFTNGNTGITATDGSLFGIEYRTASNPGVNYSLATIRQKRKCSYLFLHYR